MLRALRAQQEAGRWRAKFDKARELAASYPEGQPSLLSDDEALAGEVAAALSMWRSRPEVPVLTGMSAAEIHEKIRGLPPMPSGDRLPRAEAVAALRAFERSVQALELHEAQRPTGISPPDAKG